MKQKNKKMDFLVLLGTLCASLTGNMLAGKGFIRAGEKTVDQSWLGFLMQPQPLTNFEIQKWQN